MVVRLSSTVNKLSKISPLAVDSVANNIESVFLRTFEWSSRNKLTGYDPFDILGNPIFIKMIRSRQLRPFVSLFLGLLQMKGNAELRRLLLVSPNRSHSTLAYFARSCLIYYRLSRFDEWLEKARSYLQILLAEKCDLVQSSAWCLPFDWQSTFSFFPRRTPIGVTTAMVGEAFVDMYLLTREESYLKVAESACNFLMKNLNRYTSPSGLCFSYTPLDDYRIHNANIWCARLLAKVGSLTDQSEFKNVAQRAVNFTLSDQNADGSWGYWHTDYCKAKGIQHNLIDHFHTGYVLEGLASCRTGGLDVDSQSLAKGAEFYFGRLFNSLLPKMTPTASLPVDMTSVAQAIITLIRLSIFDLSAPERALQLANWSVKNMLDPKGYFYYQRTRLGLNRTPFMRWSQAPMVYALAYLLSYLKSPSKPGEEPKVQPHV